MPARLPRYKELTDIVALNNGVMPEWLYINLLGTGDDSTRSYWTSSVWVGGGIWMVWCDGNFSGGYTYNNNGVRPVIELNK